MSVGGRWVEFVLVIMVAPIGQNPGGRVHGYADLAHPSSSGVLVACTSCLSVGALAADLPCLCISRGVRVPWNLK